MTAVHTSALPLPLLRRGKVREVVAEPLHEVLRLGEAVVVPAGHEHLLVAPRLVDEAAVGGGCDGGDFRVALHLCGEPANRLLDLRRLRCGLTRLVSSLAHARNRVDDVVRIDRANGSRRWRR